MGAIDLDALMDRLRARAADPDRRVDQRSSRFDARVRGMALGELITTGRSVADMLAAVVTDNRAGRMDPTRLAAVSALAAEMDEPVDGGLGPPLTDDAIDGAEATLGLRLPLALRRAYRDVADGGFGPGSGLLPLARAMALLADFRRESPGPRRPSWPAPYLPLVGGPDGCDLVDCATGSVYAWDPGGLGEHSRDATWRRSFSPIAPSVEKWLDGWVGAQTPAERQAAIMAEGRKAALRASLAHWASRTPAERARYGLPEVGWGRALFGHLPEFDAVYREGT